MPGCLDNCYLYFEDITLDYLDRDEQIAAEKEIRKSERGEPYDFTLFKKAIIRECVGGYLKDPENLRTRCRHYWRALRKLSDEARIETWEKRKNKKWQIMTLLVALLGIAASSFFAYLNYSKPSSAQLTDKISALEKKILGYDQMIGDKDKQIKAITLQLQNCKKR